FGFPGDSPRLRAERLAGWHQSAWSRSGTRARPRTSPMSTTPSRQTGIALITAVLVVALAAMASTAILVSAHIAIRRTANLQESELAWWYASGVESWVKSLLERDL